MLVNVSLALQRGSNGEVVLTKPQIVLGKLLKEPGNVMVGTNGIAMPISCFYQLGNQIVCLHDPVATEMSRESSTDSYGSKRVPKHCHLLGGCTCSSQSSLFCGHCI